MNPERPTEPNFTPQNNAPFQLVFTQDQLKILSNFLPKGYSLETVSKSTRKSSKNNLSKYRSQTGFN